MLRRFVRAGHHAPRPSTRASSAVARDPRERVRRQFQSQYTRTTTTAGVRHASSDGSSINPHARRSRSVSAPDVVKVAVTGPAGQIGYSLLFRLASGQVYGPNQRIQINAIELPFAMKQLKGVAMELQDCGFPLLDSIVCTEDLAEGFDDIDLALLVGSKPRGPGMERGDLIKENGIIFQKVGQVLNKHAKRNVKVTVVGNPANTNALIAANNAPDIPMSNFTAMTRLDHDRGLGQLAEKAKCTVNDIENFVIWGNHSPTMYPDISNCKIHGASAKTYLQAVNQGENIDAWYTDRFIPTIQQRGAAIIHARGSSSAASAANAALAHSRDWIGGSDGKTVSMAYNSSLAAAGCGIAHGIMYSYPVVCKDGRYDLVDVESIDEFSYIKMKATEKELLDERDMVSHLLPHKA